MNYEYKKSKNKESEAIISLNDDFFNNYFDDNAKKITTGNLEFSSSAKKEPKSR